MLVVDDFAPLRRLLVRQLTGAGHAVVGEAGSVAATLRLIDALARRGLPPDVVVLDFHLPDGLGTDVAAHLGTLGLAGSGSPGVVMCTGDVPAAQTALARWEGADTGGWTIRRGGRPFAVLEKPVQRADLDRAVRAAATGAATGAATRVTTMGHAPVS